MNYRTATCLLLCLFVASTSLADILVIDVTRSSQKKENIDWLDVSVTNVATRLPSLLFTVTIKKDMAHLAETAGLFYLNDSKQMLMSVPLKVTPQSDGSLTTSFILNRSVLTNCRLQLSDSTDPRPGNLTEFVIHLDTYVDLKKDGKNVSNKAIEGTSQ